MYQLTVLIFIFLSLLISIICGVSLTGEMFTVDNPVQCNKNEYFNTKLLKCIPCNSDLNLTPSSNGVSCTCDDRSKIVQWSFSEFPVCQKCDDNEVPTLDQHDCITCPVENLVTMKNQTYCDNFLCASDSQTVERFPNGTLLSRLSCVKCSNGTQPSLSHQLCVPCVNKKNCDCLNGEHDLGEFCSSKSDLADWPDTSEAMTITYLNGRKVISNFFKHHLRRNIFLCKMNNVGACQLIGNLCAMTLYEDAKFSPCTIFREFKRIPISPGVPTKPPLPWLYYADGDAPAVLTRRRIPTRFSLSSSSPNNVLNITAAIYGPDGTFKGLRRIFGHDIQLCPGSWVNLDRAFKFLSSYHHICKIRGQQLIRINRTDFMDLYLAYQDGSDNVLHAIPILIRNMPPKPFENEHSDRQQWQLVRRFFLLDIVSGVPLDSSEPSIIRYASRLILHVNLLGKDDEGKIFVPYFEVEYSELTKEELTRDDLITIEFSVIYDMQNKISRTIEVSMGVMSAFAVMWSAIRTWSHSKRCGRVGIDLITIGHLILFTCGNLANVFFLVVLFISLDTFIFFKGQSFVHVLLPNYNQESLIKMYIIASFSLKIIELGHLLFRQMTVDIFLIDWERPRVLLQVDEKTQKQTVSVWRTYFVANEWNEILTMRKISLNFHLMIVLFFLEVIGFQHWASSDPELFLSDDEKLLIGQQNFICQFAVGGLFYIIIYILQWIIITFVYERYIKNVVHEFVDMCSMANISVFVLALDNYGFYIHGRNVGKRYFQGWIVVLRNTHTPKVINLKNTKQRSTHGFADTDMQTIIEQLQREEDDLVGHRGLLPGSDHQTFEMRLPSQLKAYYKKVTTPLSMASTTMRWQTGRGLRGKLGTENLQRSVQAYHTMNRFLGAFLDHALKDLDYEVREKVFVESLLGIEFNDPLDKGVLYMDNGHSFDHVLFYGNELTLMSFDLMLFSFVQIFSNSFLLAGTITATIGLIIKKICAFCGRRNLAKKTLTDDRFFM